MINQNETTIIVSFASKNPERQQELREGVQELTHPRPFELRFPEDETAAVETLRDAEILFTWRFTEEMFHAAKRLKWVHLSGAGADQVLFPAFRESSTILTNSRGMHGPFIAEWTLSALLHISQRLSEAAAWRSDRQWKPCQQTMTRERFLLQNRRALIVGFGAVGEAITQRLQGGE